MNKRLSTFGIAAMVAVAGVANGQVLQRRATVTGNGSGDRGQCRVEVLVDGAAEVEIRGVNATLRNRSGQSPQWRRFDCTSTLPVNPQNLRYIGVDGRGRQELVRTPQYGGSKLVRIQDKAGSSDIYAFDLVWGVNDRPGRGAPPPPPQGRGPSARYTTQQAVQVCQDAVKQQAYDRFRTWNIAFRRTSLDNNPGRQDWVIGMFDVRRAYNRDETYNFSCSVNFDTAGAICTIDAIKRMLICRLRDAKRPRRDRDGLLSKGGRGQHSSARHQHLDFLSINVDDAPGRNDWIVGNARADVRNRSDSFSFSQR
jgi:hypothetical protein